MAIKTTVNIKKDIYERIINTAEENDVSIIDIVNLLINKTIKHHNFESKICQAVQYQERIDKKLESWKKMHVSFYENVYEKSLDLRKLFKVSVSFFFALAVVNYLDEIIDELKNKKKGDNYPATYIMLHRRSEYNNQITLLWDMIDEEKLEKLMKQRI